MMPTKLLPTAKGISTQIAQALDRLPNPSTTCQTIKTSALTAIFLQPAPNPASYYAGINSSTACMRMNVSTMPINS